MIFWKIAYRNVKKNWRHSLSALLSLSASFISLVLFDGYIYDLKQMYVDSYQRRSMLGDFLIEKPDIHSKAGVAEPWNYWISENEQNEIKDFLKTQGTNVKNYVRFVNFQGMVTNGNQTAIIMGKGYDVAAGEKVRGENWSWNATLGLPLDRASAESPAAMLGQGLAKKLGCSWDQSKPFFSFSGGYEPVERPFDCPSRDLQVSVMTPDGQLNALDVTAVGFLDVGYKDIDDRYLLTSIETAQALVNNTGVTMMSVELSDNADRPAFVAAFKETIGKENPAVAIMPWTEHPMGETYNKTMDLMAIFRNFMVIVILIISTLSVVNTLIKIVKERSREIGTIRSFGFKPQQVMKMFLYETLLLASIGTFLGLLASLALTFFLNGLHIRYKAGLLSEPVLFKINFDFHGYLNAFAILIFVSLIACFVSTRHELKKKIIENLNHV